MMKKTLAIVFLAVMIANCSFALAEVPDIKGLSVDELYSLQAAIIKELGERKELPSFKAPIGVYEVGIDFPSGKYLLSSALAISGITVYENAQSYENGKVLEKKSSIYGDGGKMYDFKESMIVVVDAAPIIFNPYLGLIFE